MTTFRFYIVNTADGTVVVVGNNDLRLAIDYAQNSPDYVVVDTENNMWLQPDGEWAEISGP